MKANIVRLKVDSVPQVEQIRLPPETLTFSFARESNLLLVTEWTADGARLSTYRVIREAPLNETIYASKFSLRFPLELGKGKYLYLEGISKDSGFSKWKVQDGPAQTELNVKGFRLATRPSVIGDSVFLLQPGEGARLIGLIGGPPQEVSAYIGPHANALSCADVTPTQCVVTDVFVASPASSSTLTLHRGTRSTRIGSHWFDVQGLQISRNGEVVAFHGKTKKDGPRKLYYLYTADDNQHLIEISLKENQ